MLYFAIEMTSASMTFIAQNLGLYNFAQGSFTLTVDKRKSFIEQNKQLGSQRRCGNQVLHSKYIISFYAR